MNQITNQLINQSTNQPNQLRICSNCILPETFPGISFDDKGVCTHCQKFDGKGSRLLEDKKKYEQKFLDLLNQTRNLQLATRSYDILMSYSGGKDSTYTLILLKNKYRLNVLALSFDNGFISETAVMNIKRVTDSLGIDHIFFKPKWDLLKQIFYVAAQRELYSRKTLERASTICTSCMAMVKTVCLKMAIELNIPMVAYGWSPGQAPLQSSLMKNNPSLCRMAQQAVIAPLKEIAGDEICQYFLNERHYLEHKRFPYNIHPLAWELYDETIILDEIKKYGWIEPKDTDSNSTNCLLNAFANEVHLKKYGFHPYAWEIANMVREGIMDRDEGYKKIYQEQPENLIRFARQRLFDR